MGIQLQVVCGCCVRDLHCLSVFTGLYFYCSNISPKPMMKGTEARQRLLQDVWRNEDTDPTRENTKSSDWWSERRQVSGCGRLPEVSIWSSILTSCSN